MYKTKKRGREDEETGSVCVHVCVLQKGWGERVKLDIYGKKESMGGCLVHRVTCPTREKAAEAEAWQVAEK